MIRNSINRRFLPAFAVASTLAVSAVWLTPSAVAQNNAEEKVNVRGSIVSFAGNSLQVKSREGKTVNVTLADGWRLAGVARASIADIKPGGFVGIASLPKAEGGDGASRDS